MAAADATAFTIVFEDSSETPTTQELRQSLEKGTDEVKIETLRKIIVATLNGNPQVRIKHSYAFVLLTASSPLCLCPSFNTFFHHETKL